MAIRKLLLPLTGTAAGEAALSTALIIAGCGTRMSPPCMSASTAATLRRWPARACRGR